MIIIGILAGLILAAAGAARTAMRRGAIVTEINLLQQSMQQYENQYGSYPPNAQDPEALVRHLKKAFPRISVEDLTVARHLANDPTLTGNLNPPMNGAEALVFWLGGFSKDPQHPLSGPGGPAEPDFSDRNSIFAFDVGRLGANSSSMRTFTFTVNGNTRVINLYHYTPEDLTEPYVYFDTSRGKFDDYPSGWTDSKQEAKYWPVYRASDGAGLKGVVRAYVKDHNGRPEFINSDSFQILSAGLDDYWSAPANGSVEEWEKMWIDWPGYDGDIMIGGKEVESPRPFPAGPFVGEMEDNLANFATGGLGDAN